MKKEIELLVEGGNAKPGPSFAVFGPMGINVGKLIADINQKTKDFQGIKVPVKIIVDTDTKTYEIVVGTPPIGELIKKELNLEKGSSNPGNEFVKDISFDKIVKIAKMKIDEMDVKSLKSAVKCVLGTLVSMGIKVEGKNPKDVIKEVDKGVYDELIK